MDAIATLEGLNFLQAQQAAATLGGRRPGLSAYQAPWMSAGLAGHRPAPAPWMQSGIAGLRGVTGYSGNLSGMGAPEFAVAANPATTVETGRAVICQATTQAEVAKREAVALDKAAKVAASQGDSEKAGMLGREADRKAEIAIAATQKAAKAAVVVEAAKQEAVLTKQAAVAQAKGDAPKAAMLVAAVQEARKQQAEVQAAPSVVAMTCKCPGVMSKGGGLSGVLAGLGFKIDLKAATDLKGKIEAAQAEVKGAAKEVSAAGKKKVRNMFAGASEESKAKLRAAADAANQVRAAGGTQAEAAAAATAALQAPAPDCPDCAPGGATQAGMLGGALPWVIGLGVAAFAAKKLLKL